jgi:hypothetical protein
VERQKHRYGDKFFRNGALRGGVIIGVGGSSSSWARRTILPRWSREKRKYSYGKLCFGAGASYGGSRRCDGEQLNSGSVLYPEATNDDYKWAWTNRILPLIR